MLLTSEECQRLGHDGLIFLSQTAIFISSMEGSGATTYEKKILL